MTDILEKLGLRQKESLSKMVEKEVYYINIMRDIK